ncbi:MAG TPA: phosphopantetheine-binding protein [Acidimicrobiales bacterium]|nr:phosphopantetheine-binding protein [Acidimicrobiales bacterium]
MTALTQADAHGLIAKILADIAPEVDLADARSDGQLQEELGLDSMDFLNLMIGIHDETGLTVPERDYPELSTLDGAVRYLTERTA